MTDGYFDLDAFLAVGGDAAKTSSYHGQHIDFFAACINFTYPSEKTHYLSHYRIAC